MEKRDRICNSKAQAIEEQAALMSQKSGIEKKLSAYKNLDTNLGNDINSKAAEDISTYELNIKKLAAKV